MTTSRAPEDGATTPSRFVPANAADDSDRDITVPLSDPVYLTQREAARHLRVSIAYIRNSDCPKVLMPSGRGQRPLVRYVKADLDRWMQIWRVSRRVFVD